MRRLQGKVSVPADNAATSPASDTVAGIIEVAVQSEQETGSSTVLAVTPGRQHHHESAAKAWLHYTQITTPAVHDSFNVNGVTDTTTGEWIVIWETDFGDDLTYTVAMAAKSTSVARAQISCSVSDAASNQVAAQMLGETHSFSSEAAAGVKSDGFVWLVAFGDQ